MLKYTKAEATFYLTLFEKKELDKIALNYNAKIEHNRNNGYTAFIYLGSEIAEANKFFDFITRWCEKKRVGKLNWIK